MRALGKTSLTKSLNDFFKWEGGVSLSIQNLILKIFGVLYGFWPWFLENMQDGDAFVALCISSRRRRRRGRDNFHREQQAAHSSTTAAMNGDHASGDDHHHYDDDDGYHEVRGEWLSPGHTITIFYPVNFNHGHGTIGLECETMILLRARYYNISKIYQDLPLPCPAWKIFSTWVFEAEGRWLTRSLNPFWIGTQSLKASLDYFVNCPAPLLVNMTMTMMAVTGRKIRPSAAAAALAEVNGDLLTWTFLWGFPQWCFFTRRMKTTFWGWDDHNCREWLDPRVMIIFPFFPMGACGLKNRKMMIIIT